MRMHRELFHPNTGETTRSQPTGIRPYGRSWQRPGVALDHWPVPRRRTRMSWRGFLAGRSTGRCPVPRNTFARTSRLYRLQELAGDHGNLGRRSRRTAPATSRRPTGKSFTIILTIFRNSCRWRPSQAAGRFGAGAASRRDTGRRRGPGAQARAAPRHDRHGPNPRPPAQIRSNVPRGATR